MRKLLIVASAFVAVPSFADNVTDAIAISGDHVYSYTPYVQTLGYVLAALIGLVGAFSVYLAYINDSPDVRKRMLTWGCGSLAMLCMTIALPSFFDYQESGLGGSGTTGGSGGTGSYTGGDRYGQIDTSIPDLGDGRWIPDDRFLSVKINGKTISVATILNEVYSHMGAGVSGSYGRTLAYIDDLYHSGAISQTDYTSLIQNAGNLPHN